MRFTLDITLGNEAMQTAEDIATALAKLGEQLATFDESNWPGTEGIIRDENGNTVGTWQVA